ncbi:helix-turn-helix domain-containing protein [Lachnospiraceae bacterium ASD3451]|uniref:helix-turn-helix domain-containing protein n=1 Tax=Diplocloster agilis TaxID=2850323 RepID=UPI001DAB93C3|nr:helix-turn-helix transcriptional regulator [Diplocloster agilis]MBU9743856.1 helix-turn-helix domain-containing protein [Diplocloster agilis]
MFSENLRTVRTAKGFSQQELAGRLHVVRQTISKWEKGISVPDADMLIRISEILELSVSELLGAKITEEMNQSEVAEQLARINEQLAAKNRRTRRILRIVMGFLIGIVVFYIILLILSMASFNSFKNGKKVEVTAQTETVIPEE